MTVELNRDEARHALTIIAAWTRHTAIAGRPVPQQAHALLQKLDIGVRCAMSPRRQENTRSAPQLDTWIGTSEAARMLGCRTRTVQRRAAQLGGHKIGDRWLYPTHRIREAMTNKAIQGQND